METNIMKKLIIITFALLIVCLAVNNADAVPIYSPVTGSYYEAIGGTYTWGTANSNANSSVFMGANGHLAVITSGAEDSWIWNNVISGGNPDYYWLGGYQDPNGAEPGTGWQWVTGEAWSYTNWNGGEPNNNNKFGYEEDWLTYWNNGKWNDLTDDPNNANSQYFQGYIVEYENVIPEPISISILGILLAGLPIIRKKK
jgi:hypothetical protein